MARTEIPLIVLDPATGNAVVGASVTVRDRITGASSTVYAAETGATTVTNPRTTDAYGRVAGWIERGSYQFDISGTGLVSYTEYYESSPGGDGTIDTNWIASSAVTPQKSAQSVVSSFPTTNLVDGMEVAYQSGSSMTGLGAVWRFKYRAAATGNKWEFVGGPPISIISPGGTITCTASFTGYTLSPAVSLTPPISGYYDVRLENHLTTQSHTGSTLNYVNAVHGATTILNSQVNSILNNLFGTYYIGGPTQGVNTRVNLTGGVAVTHNVSSFTAGNQVSMNHVAIYIVPVSVTG